ncbi:hypothetical protein ACIGCP_09990 [Cellulophaga baltica]|uniref:hypothetical protein n=1 Tax=Cellulophaga baltica TaxID=76594 RepID=UPI0037C5FCC9
MKRSMLCTVMMAVFLLFSGVSCKKDTEFSETVLLPEEEVIINVENTIVIPENFDWSNIPADYKDAVWDIQFDFDLNAATIVLPEGVTLYFTGGSLSNGTVTGDGTSTIVSKTKYQIFEGIDLAGTFVEEQYLMPYWFGAIMNGITDDRDVFVETLAQAHAVTARVMVDKDIFLDVEQTGTKSIFLEDNTWIEGKNDANIIINSLYSPAFYLILIKDITIKNLIILYDQSYDASFGWDTSIIEDNILQLRYYLEREKEITFSQSTPLWNGGPVSFRALFSIESSESIKLENIEFKAKSNTADGFIQEAIKFKEQFSANQNVINDVGVTSISKQITLSNITMDGVLMGIQGIVEDLTIDNLKSYRYSDAQSADGSNIGGAGYWMPPPHLIYLNMDSSVNGLHPKNISIKNTIDKGEYVGSNETRGSNGYCHSLKLVDHIENVTVENYQSFRRDGLGDIGGVINGFFKNVYAESTSDIFDPNWKFNSLRFVGALTNTVLEDITVIDNSDIAKIYPMDFTEGNYVTWDNIQVFVNELNTSSVGFFGIFGSNNTIVNSSLTINKHTSKALFNGLIFHDDETLANGSNNHYEITVNGWRTIDDDYLGESCRMLFANSDNTNINYAKVEDTSNNFITEQYGNLKTDIWTRTELVILKGGISQKLKINIPAGFMVQKISANTLEKLESGVKLTLGTSNTLKSNLISSISESSGLVVKQVNELIATNGNREIYLHGDKDFNNTGKLEIILELVRGSQY